MNKMKSFIKDKTLRMKSKIIWLHQQCKQPVKDNRIPPNIPYQIVSQWLLDIVMYGFIITFIWNAWLGYQGWNNINLLFANGFAFWMIGELIKHVRQAMKEQ